MRPPRWKTYGLGAGGMLVVVMAILLATGWSSAVAKQLSDVFVTNDAAHPVPVQEQRTDANGNIKVHEQGTANVNVTNASLPVASQPPITSGGAAYAIGNGATLVASNTASALSLHLGPNVNEIKFNLVSDTTNEVVADFVGPAIGGKADVDLALDRPIKFNRVQCFGSGPGSQCSISLVGASP
jgi:hypothetical protein